MNTLFLLKVARGFEFEIYRGGWYLRIGRRDWGWNDIFGFTGPAKEE